MTEQETKNDAGSDKQEAVENTGSEETQKTEGELSPEQRLAELNDKYIRLYAEFDNFRKRTAKERIDIFKYAGEEILKALLPVVDDFERGMKANENLDDIKAINEGVALIYHKFQLMLKQKGIEPMDAKGKEFDAETMEAITNIPAPSPDLKGKVVDEVEKGYLLNGKVIRYAKVVVGS